MMYKGSVVFSVGRVYRDGVRNLEVMLESLSGRIRPEIQEGRVMKERGELGEAKCNCIRHADCR